MKLIFCPVCYDIVKCQKSNRTCQCGASGGRYAEDGLNAVYWGTAVPLGISNPSFVDAAMHRPKEGMGECFIAFVIPEICPTFKKVENAPAA